MVYEEFFLHVVFTIVSTSKAYCFDYALRFLTCSITNSSCHAHYTRLTICYDKFPRNRSDPLHFTDKIQPKTQPSSPHCTAVYIIILYTFSLVLCVEKSLGKISSKSFVSVEKSLFKARSYSISIVCTCVCGTRIPTGNNIIAYTDGISSRRSPGPSYPCLYIYE